MKRIWIAVVIGCLGTTATFAGGACCGAQTEAKAAGCPMQAAAEPAACPVQAAQKKACCPAQEAKCDNPKPCCPVAAKKAATAKLKRQFGIKGGTLLASL